MIRSIRGPVLLLAAALLLSGCVTTSSGGFREANEQEEIERRVEAAAAYLAQGNTEQAIVHLRRAIELDDRSPMVHDQMAKVFVRTGEFERAEEHYRRAIALDGNYSRARNNYAALLYRLERYPEAMEQLEKVVADTLYEARPMAFVNLGLCALRLDRKERAEEAFRRALLMDDRFFQAALELSELYYEQGEAAEALRYYEQFRRRAPRQTPRSLMLGIELARVFQDLDAEASYALALKSLYPKSQEYLEYKQQTTP